MIGGLMEMARIALGIIPCVGLLGAVSGGGHERPPRLAGSQPKAPDTSGIGFLIMAQHGTCFTPGPALPGVAPLQKRGR